MRLAVLLCPALFAAASNDTSSTPPKREIVSVQALGETDLGKELCLDHAPVSSATNEGSSVVDDLQASHRAGGTVDILKLGDDDAYLEEYVTDLAYVAVPMLVCGILALLVCPFLFCARTCCAHKCCKPRKDGYDGAPSLFCSLAVFTVLSIVALAYAVTNLNSIDGAVSASVGGVCELEVLQGNADAFFDELVEPLDAISYGTSVVIDEVKVLLTGLSPMRDSLNNISGIISNFAQEVGEVSLPEELGEPAVLAEIKSDMILLRDDVQATVTPIVEDLDATKENVDTQIVDAQQMLKDIADPAYEMVSELRNETQETLGETVGNLKDSLAPFPPQISTLSIAAHVPVFLGLFAGLVAGGAFVAKAPKVGRGCLTATWTVIMVYVIIMFLLAGVLTPLSVVFSDVCVLLDDIPNNFSKIIPDSGSDGSSSEAQDRRLQFNGVGRALRPDRVTGGRRLMGDDISPSSILDGCFKGVPIMQTLNMTQSFDLEGVFDTLNRPWRNKTDELLVFPALDESKARINSLSVEDFGLRPENVTQVIDQLNAARDQSNDAYVRSDCEASALCDEDCQRGGGVRATCAPESANLFIGEPAKREKLKRVRALAVNVIAFDALARSAIEDTIAMMQRNIAAIEEGIDTLKTNIQDLEGKLDSVKRLVKKNIIDEVTKVNTASVSYAGTP